MPIQNVLDGWNGWFLAAAPSCIDVPGGSRKDQTLLSCNDVSQHQFSVSLTSDFDYRIGADA